jgi:hypothetical protein
MKAKVNINYRDMQGREYEVKEISGNRVTLVYILGIETILIDFIMREVEIIFHSKNVEVYRNQAQRDGCFVNYSPKYGYVIQYTMPNGREFKNVVKNPFETGNYKAISDKEYTKKFINHNN